MMYFDQDILGIMSYDWPSRFYKLNRRYNWNARALRNEKATKRSLDSGVCVEHFKNGAYNMDLGTGRAELYTYWHDYRRIAPSSAVRHIRGSGSPVVPWTWEVGTGRSLGPANKQTNEIASL